MLKGAQLVETSTYQYTLQYDKRAPTLMRMASKRYESTTYNLTHSHITSNNLTQPHSTSHKLTWTYTTPYNLRQPQKTSHNLLRWHYLPMVSDAVDLLRDGQTVVVLHKHSCLSKLTIRCAPAGLFAPEAIIALTPGSSITWSLICNRPL